MRGWLRHGRDLSGLCRAPWMRGPGRRLGLEELESDPPLRPQILGLDELGRPGAWVQLSLSVWLSDCSLSSLVKALRSHGRVMSNAHPSPSNRPFLQALVLPRTTGLLARLGICWLYSGILITASLLRATSLPQTPRPA
ncbi:hypothetical protein IQ07DRAFT_398314 [Pyrenochaeta sp. DS3sAY3a]|nr:hypothetical protein IQ07DRAFT_398314 [Pyrenochaeta sp. DS3sAY3a]